MEEAETLDLLRQYVKLLIQDGETVYVGNDLTLEWRYHATCCNLEIQFKIVENLSRIANALEQLAGR